MHKRIITTIAILIICVFVSITTVNAATKLALSENSNGNVKATLHFEDGFVGGFDITLKYSGDVKYKQINLDSKLTNSKYTNKVTFNEQNKTINIKVTTGGVGTSHNLLNVNKELVLGNIVFVTTEKSDTHYTLECSKLTVLDNAWKSQTVTPELKDNSFTLKINDEKDNNDNNEDKDDEQNTGDNASNNNGSSTGTNNNSNNNSSNNSNNNSSNNSSNNGDVTTNGNSGNTSTDNGTDNDNSTDDAEDGDNLDDTDQDEEDTTDSESNDSEDKKSNDKDKDSSEKDGPKVWEIIVGVALVLVAGTICFLAIKAKKSE